MNEDILKEIRGRGLLLEKDIFELVDGMGDVETARDFLEKLERYSGQKIITRNVLNKNFEFVKSFVSNLGDERKNYVENVFVKMGISLEIVKEQKINIGRDVEEKKNIREGQDYRVFYADTKPDKKLEVKDFVGYFRARYQELQRILMGRPEIQGDLRSIGKIGSDRQQIAIIGIVKEKRVTKNKNMIITFEDLTGTINALIKPEREEIFGKAEEIMLDDIIAIKASGSREMLFIHDIFFPDAFNLEKTKFEEDANVLFISDIHCGSDRHLERSFGRFLEWLNSEDENAKKVKYIFIVGDNVDGVGIYPGQEGSLKLKSMKEQYSLLAFYLSKVPKRIQMFMCAGQHDAVRVAEPQPIISRRYAEPLYGIENLTLVTNPTLVKLLEKSGKTEKEFKILMYHGASIHQFINEIKELREMKAHKCPAKAVRHMLKRRHLSPVHGEAVYIPNDEKDPLVISEVPDVLCTGEVHKMDIENYNGVLIVTGSCWQAQTDFEEKIGNIPEPGRVCLLNLHTRELKVLDFLNEEEIQELSLSP